MPSYTMLNVKMQRDSNETPWGFRMQGGKDFSTPLQILKVNPGSLAERCGIQANDYIVKIGSFSAEHLKHPDAQDLIRQQNNALELTLQRGAPPDANDYNSIVQFPPHQLMQTPSSNLSSVSNNRPTQATSPQVAMPITNNRALLSQAHNTPIGLYSADNVTEAITRTLKSSPPPFDSNMNHDLPKFNPKISSSNVEDLQQKYLYADRDNNQKSLTRQGPAFRALVRGLDENQDTTPTSHFSSNNNNSSNSKSFQNGLTNKNNQTNTQNLNVKPEYSVEQPKNYDEFKSNVVRSMGKIDPAPVQQVKPTLPARNPPPVAARPYIASKPMNNDTVQEQKPKVNQGITKGKKGSALLNRNETLQQSAKCYTCGVIIRGPYISAIGQCFCIDHFKCSKCSMDLIDCGFVEENGKLYCEQDFEKFLAPHCAKCSNAITKECVHALEKTWHPECFTCVACRKSIGTGSFHVEEGQPYCIEDYRRMFQEKCTACDFPIEPGDKYLEAMGGIYHVECFTCSMCQVCLNGQPFVVKQNRPYCRLHAR